MNNKLIIQYIIIAGTVIAVMIFLEDSELKDTLLDIFTHSLSLMRVDQECKKNLRISFS